MNAATLPPFPAPPGVRPPRPWGLMAALQDELGAVLDAMPDATVHRLGSRDFWAGHLHGRPVVAVLSRVGKVAAATTATLLATVFDVERLLFTGVAGGLGPGMSVGDIVVADHLLQHDLDASPLFPRWEIPLTGRSRLACDAAWTAAVQRAACGLLAPAVAPGVLAAAAEQGLLAPAAAQRPRVHRGLVISGDRFVCTQAESAALQAALPDALAVEMEGAAVAQVCEDFGVPLAVVRTISDRADDHAAGDFDRFVREVARDYTARIVQAVMAG